MGEEKEKRRKAGWKGGRKRREGGNRGEILDIDA